MKSKGFEALKGMKVRAFDDTQARDELAAEEAAARREQEKINKAEFSAEMQRLGMVTKETQEDSADLFSKEMQRLGVVELDQSNKKHPGARKTTKKPITAATRARVEFKLSDNYDATSMDDWADRDYVAVGCGIDLASKLKRNLWPVGAHLDLHGYTIEEARSALTTFIIAARQEHIRCVRIVHGKGMNSDEGPVLKMMVRRWLRQMPEVQAFIQALPGEGGSGAVRVLLTKKLS